MTRDRIWSKASFKSKVWTGTEVPWPSLHDADFEGSKLVSGEDPSFVMTAGGAILSDSPVLSSIAVESLEGSRLPSSDLVTP